jgi:hypothetical protein
MKEISKKSITTSSAITSLNRFSTAALVEMLRSKIFDNMILIDFIS